MKPNRNPLAACLVAAALAVPASAQAVRLSGDHTGQALIYPYYTIQTANGDTYNTYVSIVNHTGDAKALRVRFREGRASREVFSLNVYLGPHDMWTGAVIPSTGAPPAAGPSDAPSIITADGSCTSPALPLIGSPFSNALYSGANDDGNGTGLDRAKEGFFEVVEMGTLTGASATAVSLPSDATEGQRPPNCAAVQGNATLQVGPPSGGLSGTETLINVRNGINFDLDAVALAELSTQPFYRPASDPYPDFNAAEIDPVSVVVTNGAAYRSVWSRPVDAVSAVFMSASFAGEYVLDNATASNTDVVVTFPTRHYYAAGAGFLPPFYGNAGWADGCENQQFLGQISSLTYFNREEQGAVLAGSDFPEPPPGDTTKTNAPFCASVGIYDVENDDAHTFAGPATRVLGSRIRGVGNPTAPIHAGFQDGWLTQAFSPPDTIVFASLPGSTRIDLATGAQATGSHRYQGLPVVGFTARTLVNGTLQCNAGACQGNYGAAYPFQYRRSITP